MTVFTIHIISKIFFPIYVVGFRAQIPPQSQV